MERENCWTIFVIYKISYNGSYFPLYLMVIFHHIHCTCIWASLKNIVVSIRFDLLLASWFFGMCIAIESVNGSIYVRNVSYSLLFIFYFQSWPSSPMPYLIHASLGSLLEAILGSMKDYIYWIGQGSCKRCDMKNWDCIWWRSTNNTVYIVFLTLAGSYIL